MILTEAALARLEAPERPAWIAALSTLTRENHQRYERITRTAARLFKLPLAMLTMVETTQLITLAGVGVEAGEVEELQHSLCTLVVAHNAPLLVPDTLKDSRLTHHGALHQHNPCLRCYYGVPVHAPDGLVLGALAVAGFQPCDLRADVAQLEDLASWVESEWARSFFTHNQEQQRAATEGLATITRSIADGVLVFDRQGKVVHVNRLAEHYLGVTNPLQAGDNVLEIVPAGPARNHLQWLLDHGPPQAPMRSEVLLRTAHGNQVPVEVTMTSTEDKAWFVAIGHDVSERVRHEKALAALGQRFESILDAAADAIVRVNRKGLIEYANSSMASRWHAGHGVVLGDAGEQPERRHHHGRGDGHARRRIAPAPRPA